MNQQGALRANYAYAGQNMASSQNGRGGTFYVLQNQQLFDSLTQLLKGDTAPTSAPGEKTAAVKQKPAAGQKKTAPATSKTKGRATSKKVAKKKKTKAKTTKVRP